MAANLYNESQIIAVAFNKNTAATHEVVAAVAGKTYKVVKCFLIAASAVDVTFKSATTVISGGVLTGITSLLLPLDGKPWFTCAAGEALNITLGGAVQTSGIIFYTEG